MEIKHLHSFCAVAEELSFINASRKLHISQPALSAQIQALEADVGVQLLARTRRSVRLTRPGEAFLRSAEAIMQMAHAVGLDPGYAAAHTWLARVLAFRWIMRWDPLQKCHEHPR